MTKTHRWPSTRASDRPLYHSETGCPEGGVIELEYRRPGNGGRAPCPRCAGLLTEKLKAGLLPPGREQE